MSHGPFIPVSAANRQPSVDDLRKTFAWKTSGPFGSQSEMVAAMASPRYRMDPVYQQQVAERLAQTDRSQWLGGSAKYHAAPEIGQGTRTMAIGGAPHDDDSNTPRW